ncbi:hypothetical protein Lfu02_66760 [Longispora fulva]|uniref:DUF3105 domain-containing protein n=1 Tax=Longispora fulva TaxID=619741 RepID=A0A8J7KM04_9ACTN|nr:DUF3105 domain-containing protein [Longispora fulva]MBG6138591.1 hypothetical protein [Longispora fulva]GIG62304.1 hypothetical protein Lfu02_66760 [Longispora fulva]
MTTPSQPQPDPSAVPAPPEGGVPLYWPENQAPASAPAQAGPAHQPLWPAEDPQSPLIPGPPVPSPPSGSPTWYVPGQDEVGSPAQPGSSQEILGHASQVTGQDWAGQQPAQTGASPWQSNPYAAPAPGADPYAAAPYGAQPAAPYAAPYGAQPGAYGSPSGPYGAGQAPPYGQPAYGTPGYSPQQPPGRSGVNVGLVVGLVAVTLVIVLLGSAALVWALNRDSTPTGQGTPTGAITGLVDYRTTNPGALTQNHTTDPVTYPMSPPAGGPHFPVWQNCMGDVYTKKITSEKAVHSLEHGAVWITYDPQRVGAADVEKLAARVRGVEYTLMSPFPGQGPKISIQAWGYQLGVDSASDKRIGQFLQKYRVTASLEPGAVCSGGATE